LAGWVGTRLRRQFEATIDARSAHERVTNLFGQHVSPQVVERLLASGAETLSEMRRVAVMFVDIRSFTAAARMRRPEEVVARLDDAFAVMVEAVDRNGGVVNKFLGDGFLALFGAPLKDARATQRAVLAGREMLEAIAQDNGKHPAWPIRIGIGLHVGETVTGTVGSPRRKEYTVIGDTVNLASRIEAANKEFGAQFLLSDAARREVGDAASDATLLGDVAIRGYDAKIPLWRLA
jgi:adenylate cyclase